MTPINYPNEAFDLALLGKPSVWQRRLMLRPLRAGQYSLLAWPADVLELRTIQRMDLTFRDGAGAPQAVLLTIPKALRPFRLWTWRLVRWPGRFSVTDEQYEPLTLKKQPPASALIFEQSAVMEGSFSLADDHGDEPHRIALWSCNQPYATGESGEAELHPDFPGVLDWAEACMKDFAPHAIWGLGDTAYADGTPATNFVDQAYDEADLARNSEWPQQLRSAYRRMYRAHWSFSPLQRLMRRIPHLCMWDDHEIRDGWGSEDQDFAGGNPVIFTVAREVADEFVLQNGPRLRPTRPEVPANLRPDAHQAYMSGRMAAFVFDGRTSRRYSDPESRIVSEEQFEDFGAFCEAVAVNRQARFLVLGCAVPFINLKDFVEELGSKAPKALTDLLAGIRDDMRDSWHSPGNRPGLKRIIGILRKLHLRRPDLDIVVVSGDIHVANAFSFQPPGFLKALYQFTSSALTNRDHPPEAVAALVDLGTTSFTEVLGFVTRIWDSIGDPNLMTLEPHGENLRVSLRVFDLSLPPAERGKRPSEKDLVFDVGNETFGLRRMLAA